MILRSLTTVGVVAALAVGSVGEVKADAGDFIGGAIVGGLIGHAITKDQQNKSKRRTTTTTTRAAAPNPISIYLSLAMKNIYIPRPPL